MDKLRARVLYKDEVLKVRYIGTANNFSKGKILKASPRGITKSGLPYPQPKWIACDYAVEDLDGDYFTISKERYGKLYKGFEWVI